MLKMSPTESLPVPSMNGCTGIWSFRLNPCFSRGDIFFDCMGTVQFIADYHYFPYIFGGKESSKPKI